MFIYFHFYLQPDPTGERAYGTVVYDSAKSAAYAMEKLHGFDYPLGSRILLKFDDSPPYNMPRGGAGGPGVPGEPAPPGAGPAAPNMPPNVKSLVDTIQQATAALQASGYGGLGGAGGLGAVMHGLGAGPFDPSMFSGQLPDSQPLAPSGAECAERLFFVCKAAVNTTPVTSLYTVVLKLLQSGNSFEKLLPKASLFYPHP